MTDAIVYLLKVMVLSTIIIVYIVTMLIVVRVVLQLLGVL
jgi:hypothetical protein